MDKARTQELAIQAAKQSEPGKAVIGRPSSYTEEKAASLIQWVESGKSLSSWCKKQHVAADSVYRWLRDQPQFRERYAHAHEVKADTLADQLIDLVDNAPRDMTREQLEYLRLRVDVRRWIASKLRPTKWGDRALTQNTAEHVIINIGIPPKAPMVIEAAPAVIEATRSLEDRGRSG